MRYAHSVRERMHDADNVLSHLVDILERIAGVHMKEDIPARVLWHGDVG